MTLFHYFISSGRTVCLILWLQSILIDSSDSHNIYLIPPFFNVCAQALVGEQTPVEQVHGINTYTDIHIWSWSNKSIVQYSVHSNSGRPLFVGLLYSYVRIDRGKKYPK